MAYTDFLITTVDTDTINKRIVINGTYDFDPESVNNSNISLLDKETKNLAEYDLQIKGKSIILTLLKWPIPNKEYILSIQKLKSIVGDELYNGIRRRVFFNSKITSTINILKPADNEVLKDLILKWEEQVPSIKTDSEYIYEKINNYYLEISSDPGFYKIINHSIVNDTTVQLKNIDKGQYYLRVRAQKDNEYGKWSETKTFIVDSINSSPDPVLDENDFMPVIEDVFEVVSFPEDNETPNAFYIEFDDEIDPNSIKNLMIFRRKI